MYVYFHLECLGFTWKIVNDEVFCDVKFTLDNMMKLRTSQGIGISVRKAEVLSATDEDLLWLLGLLGTDTPEKLLNTVVFVIGKGFTLHAGKEHRALKKLPFHSQFKFMHDCDGDVFIRYTEDIRLKTNKGGIREKFSQKKLICMAVQTLIDAPFISF